MATPIPTNAAAFTVDEILAATGGRLVAAGAGATTIAGVSTDTRALAAGAAFVALAGERHDGHTLVDVAAGSGAALAIVERDVAAPRALALVRVESTVDALGALARLHRRRWGRTAIAITGSAGKTTTRVAIAALFERLRPGEVHATAGNLNNRVGAPMVVLGLEPRHRFLVAEVGTNQPGEIAALAEVVMPDVAVLTLVAAAHVEGLGSIEGVATEKGALFRALGDGGTAIGNTDDARVAALLERAPGRSIGFGLASGAYRVVERRLDGLTRQRISLATPHGPVDFTTPLLGEAGALACAAAIACVEAVLGEPVRGDAATDAFATADIGGGAGRLVPRVLADGTLLVDDSYNANPASSCASIRAAAEIARAAGRRLVLVLGEMRELGREEAAGHDEVGRAAASSGAAAIVAVGGAAKRIAERADEAGIASTFAPDAEAAAAVAVDVVRPGDVVLVKGSRGVATERVVRALEWRSAP